MSAHDSPQTEIKAAPASPLPLLLSLAGTSLGVYLFGLRPWLQRWGANNSEVQRELPGDELVAGANHWSTRAITVNASAAEVWPWLAQMGQGRGGMYSYDGLDNLAGLDMHSADRILPEFQKLAPGDIIPLEPGGSGYRVQTVEPNRLLVLYADGSNPGALGEHFARAQAASTWTWLLRPVNPWETRLVVRWRARYPVMKTLNPLIWLIGLLIEPVEFVMERQMLRGIKRRAERRGRAAPSPAR